MFRRRTVDTPAGDPGVDAAVIEDHDGVVVVDESNFNDLTAGAFTIVDFWAPWCAPCKRFRPVFHDVASRYADRLRFGSCNVDENPQIAALLQVMSIPTLVLFDEDGNEAGRVVGTPGAGPFEEMVRDVAAHAAHAVGPHDHGH